MKKHITVLIYILITAFSFGQVKEQSNKSNDLTIERITVKDRQEETILLSAPNNSSQNLNNIVRASSSSPSSQGQYEGTGVPLGGLSVTPTGAASYNVPIDVPPGINGVEPQVSLNYNSQAGNGLAGYGWNLGGVSLITRIPATAFHDGQIDPVDFDSSDRFALDGQRLVLKSGTYGGNGAEYETQNFSNLKITSHGISSFGANYGPAYFKVHYPDGSVAYYGNSNNSNSRTTYAITYWENPQGIRISYQYVQDDNNISIKHIKYGGVNSGTTINEIRFIYNTGLGNHRERFEQAYINGVSFVRRDLLTQIQVFGNGKLYKRYQFSFNNTNLNYTRLQGIREYNGNAVASGSSVVFNYSDTNSSINYSNITSTLSVGNIEQRNAETVALDYTGNGKMDFVVYPKDKSDRNKFWIFDDIQSGSPNIGYQINGNFESVHPTSFLNHENKVLSSQGLVVVQNGSGSTVRFKTYGKGGAANPVALHYTKNWNAPTYSYQTSPTNTTYKKIPQRYISGDFNGDGLTDILAIGKPYTSRYCYYHNPDDCNNNGGGGPIDALDDGFGDGIDVIDDGSGGGGGGGNNCAYSCSNYTSNNRSVNFIDLNRSITGNFSNNTGSLIEILEDEDRVFAIDFNGDGKSDILHMKEGKLYVYALNANNYLILLWQLNSSNIKLDEPLLIGDYNGDGKTDFMDPFGHNSASFTTYFSTGTGVSSRTQIHPFTYKQSAPGATTRSYDLIPVDINGDGKTDIIEYNTVTYNGSSNGSQTVRIYNSEGYPGNSSAFDNSIDFENGGVTTKYGKLKHLPIPIFLSSNESNKNLEFGVISNQWVHHFSFTQDHREDVLLRSIDENGVTHSIDYNNLDSDYNNLNPELLEVYFRGYDQVFPYVDIAVAPDTKIVTRLQRISPGNPTLKQIYAYKGAVYNTEGLGFLGFTGLSASNWHTSLSDAIYTTTIHDPLLRGTITHEYSQSNFYTFNIPNSGHISKSTYNNSASLSSNKVFKLWVNSMTTEDNLQGINSTTTYVYDNYNNPTQISENYNATGSVAASRIKDITYSNNTGSNYHIGRPINEEETVNLGSETFNTRREYTYSGYLITQKRSRGHNTLFDVETYTYDTFGNVITKTITPNGSPTRTINFEYDTSGRFLTKSTDVEGLETTYEYNNDNGTLIKETNPFNQSTTYEYDGWFRLIKSIDYLGNAINTSYQGDNHLCSITGVDDEGAQIITFYDVLGRLTEVQEKDVLGQLVSTSYLYDKFDRVYRKSEPYIGSGATQWNETFYDVYGRTTGRTLYTGRNISISYNGLSVTVDDAVKTVTTTYDVFGNVASVTDPGGTINYTNYANGSLKSSNFNGIIVSAEQDGWGRRTKLTDPSAGTHEYLYNGFGELTKEISPKGETEYTYSSIGKLNQVHKTGDANTNMTIQYTYDPNHKFLTSINLTNADGNNSTYSYSYDNEIRLKSTTELNSYAQFTKQYTYDSFGRIDTEQYHAKLLSNNKTSTKKIRNIYQNGDLLAIKDFNTNNNIWTLTGVDARDQLTSASIGFDVEEQNTYDTYGYLTETKINKLGGASPVEIMKLTNSFNAQRGILNSRTNSMFSWSETFGYDDLDRLVTFNDNDGNNSHAYDNYGRITTNNTIGNYNYSGTSYQLTGINLNNQGDLYFQQNEVQRVTYNSFKKPVEIEQEGQDKVGFQYNAFMGRSHMFYGGLEDDATQRNSRKHYSYDGSMEINYDTTADVTTFVTYIGGDAYTAPAIFKSEQGPNIVDSYGYFYLHRDYLGSIMMISNGNGTIKEKRHFDAWGNIVKVTDGANNELEGLTFLDRGYTGHEHLQGVGLIHMNGRLYDSKTRRFLAPDNYIQDPYNTQNYNRYGYVLNNPLSYTDPTGELFIELGALIAIAVKVIFAASAVLGAIAIIDGFIGSSSSGSMANSPNVTPQNNSQEVATTMPQIPGSGFRLDSRQMRSISIPPIDDGQPNYRLPEAIKRTLPPPPIVEDIPNGNNLRESSGGITAGAVADTLTDFLPGSSVKDIYRGIRDGNGWQVAAGTGFLILDVVTLGSGSVIRGGLKAVFKGGKKFFRWFKKAKKAKSDSTTIFRSVSPAELDDIAKNGIRNKPGAYETSKLFAPTIEEATKFGKNNFRFDGIPNTIIKVDVPNSILDKSLKFFPDEMNAIAIPAELLKDLKATRLNFSPIVN